MYQIIIDKIAAKSLKNLPKPDQKKIIAAINDLSQNPRPLGAKTLQGNWKGFCRIRIGNYRVIYDIDDEIITIYVLKIAHRKDIYE